MADDNTSGNVDADEEESMNDADDTTEMLDTFIFDQEEFERKLREVPELPPMEPEGCGASASGPRKSQKETNIPVGDRLTVRTRTTLDAIKDKIPLPRGRTPPLSLPSWHFLQLEKKIPRVQAPPGLLYHTRGKLCETLLRPTVEYSGKDPLNMERIATRVEYSYSALHDPHARAFLRNPLVRRQLLGQGLINEKNEVFCTMREFNRYRDYLRTQYNDEVWKQLGGGEGYMQSQIEQIRALLKAENNAEGKQSVRNNRIANAKAFQAQVAEYKRKKAEQQKYLNEQKLRDWAMEKEARILEHVLKGIEEQKRNNERIQMLRAIKLEEIRTIFTKTTNKMIQAEARRRSDKAVMDAAYNKFLLDWLQSKYVFSYEHLIQERQLQEELAGNIKYRAKQRLKKLEKYRENMPNMLAKKKADYERLWAIVRKYAMRWLEKVRAKMNAPKDLKHESCWIEAMKGPLDEVVKYLYQESGYEKLDDFILNIMKLKKQIQAQIELEEAEEAAAAAAAGPDADTANVEGDAGADT